MSVNDIKGLIKKLNDNRKEKHGVLFLKETAKQFDDSSAVKDNKDIVINAISFQYIEDMILGMKVSYKLKNGEIVESNCFNPTKADGVKVA